MAGVDCDSGPLVSVLPASLCSDSPTSSTVELLALCVCVCVCVCMCVRACVCVCGQY